ncbi:polymorphic toxin type 28 domain-containing protein [Streptomyces pseudogriseolus]|uniref:polymorphic toxin type 28 domain-containing protein n=1 Tax=Streptomyces pseudogriseolus TaxID=36817 RepID=UPI0035AB7155
MTEPVTRNCIRPQRRRGQRSQDPRAEDPEPAGGLTERGLKVLIKKRKETIEELDRLNGFLASTGHR